VTWYPSGGLDRPARPALAPSVVRRQFLCQIEWTPEQIGGAKKIAHAPPNSPAEWNLE